MMMYLSVAVPSFMKQLLTYTCEEKHVVNGHRVIIPFGKKERIGIIVASHQTTELAPDKIKPIIRILDNSPVIPKEHLQFLVKMANYYQVSINEVILASLPKDVLSVDTICDDIYYVAHKVGETPAQKKILNDISTPRSIHALMFHYRQQSILNLIQKECLVKGKPMAQAKRIATLATLSSEQQDALTFLKNQQGTSLLWGITGCGKTEIYTHLIDAILSQGKQVLVLVPEIALTPQTCLKIAKRIGVEPTPIHSQLSKKQRLFHLLKARYGHAQVIIGTRSALLTPILNLGGIIVDEEHSDSFRQTNPFFFSARDAAILRASLANIPIILGSATPSLETLHNAQSHKYGLFKLLSRYIATTPKIHLVPMEKHTVIAASLIPIIQTAIDQNQHVMLYIGKRGYARISSCHSCGFQLRCDGCERLLIRHADGLMHCHTCEEKSPNPLDCPKCHQAELSHFGAGSQQIAELAETHWPNTPVKRIDTDSMSTLQAASALGALKDSPATIIVGTQMLTKGHDIDRLNTVIVVNADHHLYSPDFRSEEKLYAELTQVAGRSGRRDIQGHVYIQTQSSNHSLFQSLTTPEVGYAYLMKKRQDFHLPPFASLACLFLVGSPKHLENLQHLCLPSVDQVEIIGPVFFPAGMRRNQVCYKVMVTASSRQIRDHAIRIIEPYLLKKISRYVKLVKQIDSHLSP